MEDSLTLGDFALIEPIAQGGMGQVWHARHPSGLEVALKVMVPEGSAKPAWIDALNAEIRAVAGLDHPHIVWIHDAGAVTRKESARSQRLFPEGGPWLAMELARQGTLKDAEITDWDTASQLLEQLLEALAYAHAHGIVHRDLKPANILLDAGKAKLTDFGMVFAIDPDTDNPKLGGGTPSYMAPEQFELDPWSIGPWTDLYSLGIVAYGMIFGRRPFRGSSWVQLCNAHTTRAVPRREPLFETPPEVWPWLLKMLAKDRLHRFQRAADALFALRNLATATNTSLPLISAGYAGATEVSFTDGRISVPDFRRPPLPPHLGADTARRTTPGVGLGLYGLRAMPFVGRAQERAQLWQALEGVHADGETRVMVLRGPAGVGKSRLAQWLCQRAHATGAAEVFRTTHNPLPGALDGALGLVVRALRLRRQDPDTIAHALETELAPRGLRDPDVHQALVDFLCPTDDGIRLPPSRRHPMIARVLGALSDARPLLVWLDDVQWGAETIDLCDHLVTSDQSPPTLVVMTVRDEALVDEAAAESALDDLVEHRRVHEIELRPLGEHSSVRLIEQGLGLQPNLAKRLQQRIAGNPMFAIELVGDWVEQGLLIPGKGGFGIADDSALKMPTHVGAVWERRIDRLIRADPAYGPPLLVAAALGMDVDPVEWKTCCEAAGIDAPPHLWDRLQELRLVRRDAETARLGFVHGVLRETVLERGERDGTLAPVHESIASVLDDPARRGLHLLHTEDLQAGAQLLLEQAERTAETSVRQALRLLQLRDEALGAEDPGRLEGWIMAARICRMSSNAKDGLRWARQAKRVAAARKDYTHAVIALKECAACARFMGQLARAQRYMDNAMALADGMSDSIRADVLYECAAILTDGGDLVGAERTILRASELVHTPGERCRIATLHGYILAQQHRLSEARTILLEAIPDAKATGSRVRIADLHTALGEVARGTGDLNEAEQRYRKALKWVQGTGLEDPAYRLNLGLTLQARGRTEDARLMLEGVLAQTQEHHVLLMELVAHAGLAACAADQRAWRVMRRHLAVLRDDDSGLAANDLATCLRYAGTHAMAMQKHRLAQLALQLSANQYRMLGRGEQADTVLELASRAE